VDTVSPAHKVSSSPHATPSHTSGAYTISGGNDTISFGTGSDTMFEAGTATIHGLFGAATLSGGALAFTDAASGIHGVNALTGEATLIGGKFASEFIGGTGTALMKGGLGNDTFVGGSGHDTLVGGSGANVFEFLSTEAGGQHVISNFVSGHDQLYVEGHSLSYLQSHHDVSVHGGNTYISLDGGKTTIELKGVTGLTNSDFTNHKPS